MRITVILPSYREPPPGSNGQGLADRSRAAADFDELAAAEVIDDGARIPLLSSACRWREQAARIDEAIARSLRARGLKEDVHA